MKKIFLIVAALAVIVAAYYWFFIRMTREQAIKILIDAKLATPEQAAKFDAPDSYIIARAKAAKALKLTYTIDGKTFNTKDN